MSDKTTVKAVEILGQLEDKELSMLPKEYLVKLIKTLIVICRQGYGTSEDSK